MRATEPLDAGVVERDGVGLFYEVYGEGEPTILLLPTWSIIHSRFWKMQIPYLSRHARVDWTSPGRMSRGWGDRESGVTDGGEVRYTKSTISFDGFLGTAGT